ncbi:ATP-dependent DNA helicase, RecQ family [Owenweeksia hongkongensis DSM 17368]|uniref:ATP-dependent DNA helicase RecQ n=1 Tax=Owenweeksia hongkongensis (strain DSM 17368 / CIP 108786 / JCM 12287 / NRRL B-23963 / UST20020801) TaxID=926562 RepID=G8QZ50_OWEHD|nr:ATP-dependent DNA helicase RecQ [Owenweeksia hongkongensis]AEV31433.1 ATP-dependent DNA helicase, RecQ family [Owenweeksia hongkongensis DSM 17368]
MTDKIHDILFSYWGFRNFRPLQEDIINSALSGKDTLALLPTGGGKSICFQVPIMAQKGIGIVVSPLIALMADQVQNLKNREIPAVALTSGLTYREIDIALDNCVHGRYKFLYLSPERLQSEIVQERIKRMKVNLLVVDEAHCISQWGYDFRPPYTKIAEIRELLPSVPILALTATATPNVVDDIQEKLSFPEKHVIQKSFYRPNLYYNVNHTERKWSKAIEILRRIKGSGLIYVRNRKHTVEIAQWLTQNGISADFYHAGMSPEDRKKKQEAWVNNKLRIIVCTNAFGMGIDKPDVRIVLHLELPESLEAYFQEAGRAGRDGETAYSVMLIGPPDLDELKRRHLESFPDLEFVKRTYQALNNYLQLASGTGEGQNFPFDFKAFIDQYSLPVLKAYEVLKILEREGWLTLNEGFKSTSRVHILVDRTTLYDFQLRYPKLDILIKSLTRSYGGLETEYASIQESVIAGRLKSTERNVREALQYLKTKGIIDYIPNKGDSEITINKPRQVTKHLSISNENLKDRFKDKKQRIDAIEDFVSDSETCRSVKLLKYFGEKSTQDCGHCDVCRAKKGAENADEKMDKAIASIKSLLQEKSPLSHAKIREQLKINDTICLEALRWLLDSGFIKSVGQDLYALNS